MWLGVELGAGSVIDGRVFLRCYRDRAISIGQKFRLNSREGSNLVGVSNKASIVALEGGEIKIGDSCAFTSVIISSRTRIEIGDRTMIGANVRIMDHDFHSMDSLKRFHQQSSEIASRPIQIGKDVFIGTNAIILKGVTIGNNVIVGAGAVVSIEHVPDESIVVGNPARILTPKH